MALGADRGQVLRMMIGSGMAIIAFGLAIGVALALWLTRLMGGLLFAVRASDPLALGGAALLLMGAALLAIFIPVRRATRLNPMAALRYGSRDKPQCPASGLIREPPRRDKFGVDQLLTRQGEVEDQDLSSRAAQSFDLSLWHEIQGFGMPDRSLSIGVMNRNV